MQVETQNLNVNWSVFSDDEARTIQKGIETGAHEHLAAMINSLSPEKTAEIAKVQAQLRPRNFVHKSQVQKEFEAWLSTNGIQALTPEIEAEWQAKIETEREEALQILTGGIEAEVKTTDKGTAVKVTNELSKIPGISDESVAKLNAAGIYSIDELKAKTHEQRMELLNPVVAASLLAFFDEKTEDAPLTPFPTVDGAKNDDSGEKQVDEKAEKAAKKDKNKKNSDVMQDLPPTNA